MDIIDDNNLDEEQKQVKKAELEYINQFVLPKRNNMREKKTDEELLDDARYLGKYGPFLLNRVKNRNDYERLGLKRPDKTSKRDELVFSFTIDNVQIKKSEIKKNYLKLVRVFHPDNIKKKFKY